MLKWFVMSIRVATFNVENLFNRPIAMNLSNWSEGQPILDDNARMTSLLNQDTYSDDDKAEILSLLEKYGLDKTRPRNEYLELRQIRGKLLKHPKGKPAEVIANGRANWVGWVELKKKSIEDDAIKNTARVIADVNPDIIVMVEMENRPALLRFHESILKPLMEKQNQELYDHIMVIQGNDKREINVGIMSRRPILRMVSHVDDCTDDGTPTFSRDCPEYYFGLDDGTELVVLPNHLTSKGSDTTGKRRSVQSAALKEIYEKLRKTYTRIIFAGDFNDYPDSGALDPILKETDLKDAMSLDAYQGKYPGTYQGANAKDKIDYLLLSPDLAKRVSAVDVNRKGYYAPTKWESYENINKEFKNRYNASDHHCVWADIDL
jgi:endonuclease/exonuclease/phosphatase family metal-dependent hydrolase